MAAALASRTALALLGLAAAAAVVERVASAPPARRPRLPAAGRHRVVIVGAGFGGLQAAQALARISGVELCVVDQHNHHLFQPLLYQVATAALSPDDIATPVRDAIAPARPGAVRLGTVTGVNTVVRHVICDGTPIPYDTLILATGSEPSYFGHDDWRQAAPGLKTLADAMTLRREILDAFERAAALPAGSTERQEAITFAVIGGGATGVEMAGSIAELSRSMVKYDFDGDPTMAARVVLIEGGDHILPGFAPDLCQRAADELRELGVELRLGQRVTAIEHGRVHADGEELAAGTVVWAAGVKATPVAEWLGVKPGHGGSVPVGPDLTVPGHPDVFVIGDAALVQDRHGKRLPGLAPVAKQEGRFVARTIRRRLRGEEGTRRFRYRDYGTLAAIGRNKAVAEFGRIHLSGFPAWITWAVAHIFFLIGFRNRVLVSTQWLLSYVTHRQGGRVIP